MVPYPNRHLAVESSCCFALDGGLLVIFFFGSFLHRKWLIGLRCSLLVWFGFGLVLSCISGKHTSALKVYKGLADMDKRKQMHMGRGCIMNGTNYTTVKRVYGRRDVCELASKEDTPSVFFTGF